MRILFLTRKFPPSTGGMQLFAYDLSSALRNEVDLRLVKWGGSNKWLPLVLPYLAIRAFFVLMGRGVDVIHAQDGVVAPIGWALATLFRKPYVVIIHGLDITYDNVVYRWGVRPFIRRANKVICISQGTATAAIARGVASDKVSVIPLAVHDAMYGQSDSDTLHRSLAIAPTTKTLVTVGRLVPRKGVAWFVREVLPLLIKNHPDLLYVVIGTGPERSNIEAAAAQANLTKHIRMLGKVDDATRRAAYNGADVFVMPNVTIPGDMEGFGLVLLEAALCARPIVAANTEGINEAIQDGKNGRLVPAEHAEAFAKEISNFLADPSQAASFGGRSRAYTMQHYQWSVLAPRYVQVYRQLAPKAQNP